jgi:CDP-diacylglycerol---glycerol-3-phosphate 3-phosphatidyltransferase
MSSSAQSGAQSAAPSSSSPYFSLANAITAIRFVLIVPFAMLMANGERHAALPALVVYAVALASDFADGPLARRRGTVSAVGGTFDHTTDFLFVTSAMFAGASRGAFPWILPSLIVVAFVQYFVDSYWIQRRGSLRRSNLGRYNGILYFVPPLVEIVIRLGAPFFQQLLTVLAWGLVASTMISIGQRLFFSLTAEKLPGGPPQK